MTSHFRQRHPRTLDDYAAILRRRRHVLVGCFLALAAGAIAAVVMATPFYEAQLKLMIKHDRTDSVITPAPNADTSPAVITEHDVLSQAELIKSDDLLERVASESGLTSQLRSSRNA